MGKGGRWGDKSLIVEEDLDEGLMAEKNGDDGERGWRERGMRRAGGASLEDRRLLAG